LFKKFKHPANALNYIVVLWLPVSQKPLFLRNLKKKLLKSNTFSQDGQHL